MLHSLELENFKAFGERARIPFAPITLIFGENSAGKSTILQALNLLKQTRESRETGALLLPRAENGIVDLGSFKELLFDHDLERTLSIRVEINIDIESIFTLPHEKKKIAIEFNFKRPSLKEEVLLDQIEIYYEKSSKCIARFQPSGKTVEPQEFWMMMGFFHDSRGLSLSKLAAVECVWVTDEPEFWKSEFEWCKANKAEIVSQINDKKSNLEEVLKHQTDEEDNNEQRHLNEGSQESNKRLRRDLDSLDADFKFFSSKLELNPYISKRRSEEMNTVLGVQGFLPVGVIHGEKISLITGPGSLSGYRSNAMAFDVAELAMAASHALEQTLGNLFPMGPFRRPPERWYIFTGTSPQDVGYQGDLLPDLLFRRRELVEETNKWLERLEIGYVLSVESVGIDSGDLFEVRLRDTRRKKRTNQERVTVALPDVGFGISQLLPFVVQSLVSEKQIISIEQPEVHVHPKLQADLGDLLAEAIQKPRQNQFIVETHSEHLILRLQRLVREKKIKPEDVSVIYVSRGPEGAKSERLRLDEEGDFIDEWPDGFFPERLRELR